MALKPRRVSLSPRIKPRLPVEVDRQHPLLRGVLYAQWMLNRAGVPTAEIGNRNPVLNASVTWTNEGVTFNADGHPQYANSGGWALAQSEKWTIVGRGTKFTNSPIGFEFFTALVDITNPSVKQVGIGFSNTNALKILSSGNTPGDDGVAITNGTTVDFALVHQGNGLLSCYKNGNFRYSVTHSAPSELNGLNRVWLATNPGGNTGNAVINIEYVLIFRRALIPAEIRALHADSYAPIRKRRVLVPIGSTLSPVTDSVSIVWDVKQSIQDAVSAIWNVLNEVNDSAALIWNDLSSINDAITINWLLKQQFANAVQFNWALQQIASGSITNVWRVLQNVSDQTNLSWSVKQQILDQLNVPWGVRQQISDSLNALWNVLSSTSVIDSVSLQWLVKEQLAKTQTELWNVLQRLQAGRNLRWLDLQLVQDSATLNWNLLQQLADSVNVQWHVLSNTQVIDSVTFQWSVGGLVENALNAKWNVLERLGVQEQLFWTIRQRVVDQISAVWDSLEQVGDSVSLTWHSAGRIGENLVMVWNVQTKGKTVGKVIILPMRDTDLIVLN